MRFLVIGDIMVDRYIYVRSNRLAAEAPIPVWDEVTVEDRFGGAANLARNLKAIGGEEVKVDLMGIATNFDAEQLRMQGIGLKTPAGAFDDSVMVKTRYVDVDSQKFLFRHDNFKKFSPEACEWFDMIVSSTDLSYYDCVVFSDYDKGTITQHAIDTFSNAPFTVVDSKRRDLSVFAGMNILKINETERDAQLLQSKYPNFAHFFEYCVVTKGAKGAELIMCERTKTTNKRYVNHTEQFPTSPRKAVDVTGCGDTFTAALAFAAFKSKDVRSAVKFANACAGEVVQKFGTSV